MDNLFAFSAAVRGAHKSVHFSTFSERGFHPEWISIANLTIVWRLKLYSEFMNIDSELQNSIIELQSSSYGESHMK